MKKIFIVVLAILLGLLLLGVSIYKFTKADNNESMPDIEQVQETQVEVQSELGQDSSVNVDENATEVPQAKLKNEKKLIFKLPFIKSQVKTPEPDKVMVNPPITEQSGNVSDGVRKYTPEEEELLKKIPRSDVVVVDKEIKLKSSGKYRFK